MICSCFPAFHLIGSNCNLVEPDPSTSDGVAEGLRLISPQLSAILARAEAKKLETLKLSNMDLTWLPEAIGNLKNLTSLDIAGISFTIPVFCFCAYPKGASRNGVCEA